MNDRISGRNQRVRFSLTSALASAMATLLLAGAAAPAAAREPATTRARALDVTIERDAWGMPHVYAGNTYALFYGYGHAVAQDRLFQMEMARRSTQGRVAEVLGEKFVAFDRSIRGNYWPASIHRQIERLPRTGRDILEGYADGMNAWIAAIGRDPDRLMPRQFDQAGFRPEPWTAFDVAMIFVGTMANRFSDANTEIDNLALLDALRQQHGADQGWQVFEQLKWRVDPKAVTTISGNRSYGPGSGPGPGPGADAPAGPPPYALPPVSGLRPELDRLAQDPRTGGLLDLDPEANAVAMLAAQERQGPAAMPGFKHGAGFQQRLLIWHPMRFRI